MTLKISKADNERFRETIEGIIREAYPMAELVWGIGNPPLQWLEIGFRGYGYGDLRLAVVSERNIASRRPLHLGRAIFSIIHPDLDKVLTEVDGVLVAYHPATLGGDIYKESQGNDRKGSYLRLGRVKDLEKLVGTRFTYLEIDSTMTANNVRAFVEGRPFEDFSDLYMGVRRR